MDRPAAEITGCGQAAASLRTSRLPTLCHTWASARPGGARAPLDGHGIPSVRRRPRFGRREVVGIRSLLRHPRTPRCSGIRRIPLTAMFRRPRMPQQRLHSAACLWTEPRTHSDSRTTTCGERCPRTAWSFRSFGLAGHWQQGGTTAGSRSNVACDLGRLTIHGASLELRAPWALRCTPPRGLRLSGAGERLASEDMPHVHVDAGASFAPAEVSADDEGVTPDQPQPEAATHVDA